MKYLYNFFIYFNKLVGILLVGMLFSACAKPYKHTMEDYNNSNVLFTTMDQFNYEPIKVNTSMSFDLNEKNDLFNFDTGKSYLKAFILPTDASQYYLKIKSFLLDDGTGTPYVLAPYLITLDSKYNIVRSKTPDLLRFKNTGLMETLKNEKWLTRSLIDSVLEGQMTFNEENRSEKYLLVLTIKEQINEKIYIEKGKYALISPIGYININFGNESPKNIVLLDKSNKAYTVITVITEEYTDEIKRKIKDKKNIDVVTLADFIKNSDSYIKSNIIHNDYINFNIKKGVVDFLLKYPLTPIGLTWNGGVAITRNDYQYTKKLYKNYLINPSAYTADLKKHPKTDPIHPKAHFAPLLGWQ